MASPGAVIAIGMNYAAHAAESGAAPPKQPVIFLKTPNTVAGPDDDVPHPAAEQPRSTGRSSWAWSSAERAYELDRRPRTPRLRRGLHGRQRPVGADLPARGVRRPVEQGQVLPGSTPIGPWLVTTDDVDHRALRLRSWVNDEPRQDSSTADMIFGCPTIVRHLSQYLALEPGDVVLTGTPEGVALSGRFPVPAARRRRPARDRRAGRPAPAMTARSADGIGARVSGDFDGLVGGRHRRRVRHRRRHRRRAARAAGAQVAVLDLRRRDVARAAGRVRLRRADDALGPGRDPGRGRPLRSAGHRGQQRRHGRPGHGRRQPRRGVAAGPRHQRDRHGAGDPGGAAAPARSPAAAIVNTCSVAATAGPAPAGAVQHHQGRGALAHPGDGRRPPAGGHPGQLRQPRHRRHPVGRPAAGSAPPTRRPSGRRWRPASRTAGWSPPRRWPARWRTWPVPAPARPPASRWPSTAACRPCGCGRRASSAASSGTAERAGRARLLPGVVLRRGLVPREDLVEAVQLVRRQLELQGRHGGVQLLLRPRTDDRRGRPPAG